jgi:hypothetical protein
MAYAHKVPPEPQPIAAAAVRPVANAVTIAVPARRFRRCRVVIRNIKFCT